VCPYSTLRPQGGREKIAWETAQWILSSSLIREEGGTKIETGVLREKDLSCFPSQSLEEHPQRRYPEEIGGNLVFPSSRWGELTFLGLSIDPRSLAGGGNKGNDLSRRSRREASCPAGVGRAKRIIRPGSQFESFCYREWPVFSHNGEKGRDLGEPVGVSNGARRDWLRENPSFISQLDVSRKKSLAPNGSGGGKRTEKRVPGKVSVVRYGPVAHDRGLTTCERVEKTPGLRGRRASILFARAERRSKVSLLRAIT